MSDPIQQMYELEAQNKVIDESTLELTSQNQLYNLNNEILIKQDQLNKFKNDNLNKKLQELNGIEHNIINKDRLIEQTNLVNDRNDKNIYTLFVSLFLSVILFIGVLLYSLGILNEKILTIIVTLIILIFICIVLYTYNIAHFATLVNFIDNRRNLRLTASIGNIGKNIQSWEQQRVYGNKDDWVDENCTCPETNGTFMEEENIGVDIKPGYFYYDKNAPKQNITPNGGEPINVSNNSNRTIFDKIDWVNHDKVSSNVLNNNNYNIEPNNNILYEEGKFNADSTYTINL